MVYVDEGRIGYYCTAEYWMMAHSDEELDCMALKIGMQKKIFSAGVTHYYVLDEVQWAEAVRQGATITEHVAMIKALVVLNKEKR